MVRMWYVDAGIEDTPEPVYTHCLVLSCLVIGVVDSSSLLVTLIHSDTDASLI